MPQKFKRKILKYLPYGKPAVLAGILLFLIFLFFRFLLPFYKFIKQEQITPAFFKSFIFNSESPLKKYQNRTNVIILGIAGGEHDGPDLTDTMILISIDFNRYDGAMVSIPRDMWMPSLKDKINSAYHYGEEKKKGGGLLLAKSVVEEVIGQPVHYAWVIDFSGFKKLIDLIGGVDIFVENEFTDKFYPIAGRENDFCGGDPQFLCRYETLRFEKGWQHMNGETALKYVRSRQAEGEEGTDFARGRRQQQIIAAMKNKLLKSSFLWQDPVKLKEVFGAFDDATDTDMKLSEQALFLKFFLKVSDDKIRKIVLDSGDEKKGIKGFLVNPPLWEYNGEWVLAPRSGNFEEIHQFISCQLQDPNCSIKP